MHKVFSVTTAVQHATYLFKLSFAN